MEVSIARQDWLDPRSAQVALAAWAEEYERDLRKYFLRRFGAYRLGWLPGRRDRELAQQVAGGSPRRQCTATTAYCAGRCRWPSRTRSSRPTRATGRAAACPQDGDDLPDVGAAVERAEAHQERHRALIYLGVDSGMRWTELIWLRRARVDLGRRKVPVTDQMIRLKGGKRHRKAPKTPASVRSITMPAVTAELLADHVERSPEVRERALAEGASMFITKPFRVADVRAALAQLACAHRPSA